MNIKEIKMMAKVISFQKDRGQEYLTSELYKGAQLIAWSYCNHDSKTR